MSALLGSAALLAGLLGSSSWGWEWSRQPVSHNLSGAEVAAEVRMTPTVLAAAGFTAVDAEELIELVSESPNLAASFESTRQQAAEARSLVRQLRLQSRLAPTDEAVESALANAEMELASTTAVYLAAQESAVETLCEVGPGGCAVAVLAALRQGVTFHQPAFQVTSRTPQEARTLRLAEIHAQRQTRLGEASVSSASQALSSATSVPGFVAAQQGLSVNLAGITAVLTQPE